MWFVVFQNRWPPGGPTTHRGRSFNDFEKKNWIVTGGSRTKFIHGTTCTRDDTRIISVKKRNVHWFTAPFKGQTNRITPSSYLWTEPSASLSLVKSANDYARIDFLWFLFWCPLTDLVDMASSGVSTDFERQLMNACRTELSDSHHTWSFFHLCQNLWKRSISDGHSTEDDVVTLQTFKRCQAVELRTRNNTVFMS